MKTNQLMTISSFCQTYSISRSSTYRLLSEGALKGVKLGRSTRIRHEDAEAWAQSLPAFSSSASTGQVTSAARASDGGHQ